MSISEKDLEFMNVVAEYFRSTKDPEKMPEGSVRDTAIKFGITRAKVQKILITTGDYKTNQTETIQSLRSRGFSVKEIAEELGLSQATVSSSLPYTDSFYRTAEPTDHARAVREYRAYEKIQAERQVKSNKNEKRKQNMDQKMADRNLENKKEHYREKLQYEQREMIRLHLELIADFTDEEKEIMHRFGEMKGDTISRDILVSDDLPLYALHYVIQRAFGWQNSHLHRFYLEDERIEKLAESVEQWMHQVGVIYRSPLMDEGAEFWADDYEQGSFRNWLRSKYTGPCISQCWDEGLIGARESMKEVDLDTEFYVEYGCYEDEEREAMPLRCYPVNRWDGAKNDPPTPGEYVHKFRFEVVKLRDLPLNLLDQVFERGAFDLLERLTIGEVLAVRSMDCNDDLQVGEDVSTYQKMLDEGLDDKIDEILKSGFDSPMNQPLVYSFTGELFYQYDFGDNWQIRITGSRSCSDLVENGKISQDMLSKSKLKARDTYRPVLLARDGEMLIEDVGGPSGMAEFIRDINTLKRGERDENGMTKTELKEWAKSQGWHKDNSTDFNLI